jgi:L-rhamnose mutarotase
MTTGKQCRIFAVLVITGGKQNVFGREQRVFEELYALFSVRGISKYSILSVAMLNKFVLELNTLLK